MQRAKKSAKLVEEVCVTAAGDDACVVFLDNEPKVLSYDAAYELALQLARWIQDGTEVQHFVTH